MASIEWHDGENWQRLGETNGEIKFTLPPSDPPREPITFSGYFLSDVGGQVEIPDDSPVYRWPHALAANARNN